MKVPKLSISIVIWAFNIILGHCNEVAITDFNPQITATCKMGVMNIKATFSNPYFGVIHAKDYRSSNCMAAGNGSHTTHLSFNLFSKSAQPDFCGIIVNKKLEEEQRSVQIAVRIHKTLELADDKFYVITCGKYGSERNANSKVSLKFMENSRSIREAIYGNPYIMKVEVSNSNGTKDLRVKNCIAFDQKNFNTTIIDNEGCPLNPDLISEFNSNADGTSASAVLKSMFKFPEGSAVSFQCEVVLCYEACSKESYCNGEHKSNVFNRKTKLFNHTADETFLAATTIFVLNPGEMTSSLQNCDQVVRPSWLLWLAVTLGILFLIMLLMNIFLCTAMSCSCARTEIIEKDPSVIEEYDPYRSWHGSQYGSRYSLHGREGNSKGYTSGGSTIHSNRSDRY